MMPAPPELAYAFASDNTAPATPEALDALLAANAEGCLASYGEDEAVTGRAVAALQEVFECDCEVFFVFSGTAANALAVAAVCDSFESVFCHGEAHLEKDECAAPEFFRPGLKLHLASGPEGRIDLEAAAAVLAQNRGVHSAQPRLISVTQATELGTVYRLDDLRQVAAFARRHDLAVHMDGARFANALATLGCTPAEATWRAGIDILSLGGTKNGVVLSEALLFFRRELAVGFGHRRKQGGQLASKMRFLAAPWLGALSGGAWLRRAAHANAMAARLAEGLAGLGLAPALPRQANGVFVSLPSGLVTALTAAGWHFYPFLPPDIHRFMCSWRTTEHEVDTLLAAVAAAQQSLGCA